MEIDKAIFVCPAEFDCLDSDDMYKQSGDSTDRVMTISDIM